jgi:glycosyltransferase involved in cell wall biosynthesis
MQHFVNSLLCFFFLKSAFLLADFPEKPIVILSASYNNIKWCEKSILSILNQDYSNYRIIYIDDCSNDGTADMVRGIIESLNETPRLTLIKNKKRIGALANFYWTIHNHTKDEEIIVNLDGDDWFFDSQVLKKVNSAYSSKDIWLTHGSMIEYPLENTGWSIPIPEDIIYLNAFRKFRCPSHPRTFYSWLFKKIHLSDLLYEGQFFPMTSDFATMFPMIEMAGERHAFISDILYVYNMSNELNDHKVDAELQRNLDVFIREMPPYSRLDQSPFKKN